MSSHHLNNFEVQKDQNEPKYIRVYYLSKIKVGNA